MAAIAFSVGATALAGPGTALALANPLGAAFLVAGATAIGGIIDSTLVYPTLFSKDQSIEGAKLDDLQAQVASEGSALPFVKGYENRTAGVVIWSYKDEEGNVLREIKSTETKKVGKGSKATSTSYNYRTDLAIAYAEGPIEGVGKVWANSKLIYDGSTNSDIYDDIRFYNGTHDQMPDTLIESEMGIGQTPAFRGKAYVVIENLDLSDFGNSIPQFTFEVREKVERTTAEVISDILLRSGMDSDEFDVGRIKGCFSGMTIKGSQDALKTLDPIFIAYDILSQEVNGKVYFFHYNDMEEVVVDEKDLAVNGGEHPFTITDLNDFDVLTKSTVTYIDPSRDYQSGSRTFSLSDLNKGVEENIDIPIAMTDKQARNLCINRLRRARTERQQIELTLPPKYMRIKENDTIVLEYNSETYKVRVTESTVGANGAVDIRGSLVALYSVEDETDDSLDDGDFVLKTPKPYIAPDLFSVVFETPALTPLELTVPSLKWGCAREKSGSSYRGASFLESSDDISFVEASSTSAEATVMKALTKLSPGPIGVIDRTNTVDVRVWGGNLQSASSKVSVLNGLENVIVLGQEVLGYTTATLINTTKSFKEYRLSNLIRGIRNTIEGSKIHYAGEKGCLLSNNAFTAFEIDSNEEGDSLYYKIVPNNSDPNNYNSGYFLTQGKNFKNFAPSHVKWEHNSSTDASEISWIRCSKSFNSIIGPNAGKLLSDEADGGFYVDVYLDESDDEPVHTFNTPIDTTSVTIDTTKKDDWSIGYTDPFWIQINQWSPVNGSGNKTERIRVN